MFLLSPSPLRFGLRSLGLGCSVVRLRRGAKQPLHDAANLVREAGKWVASVLIFHARTVA